MTEMKMVINVENLEEIKKYIEEKEAEIVVLKNKIKHLETTIGYYIDQKEV